LLSGGNLSGQQREEALERVLDGLPARAPARTRLMALATAFLMVSGAAAFFLFFPRDSQLRAKGARAPILRVDCEPGGLGGRSLGGTLMFAVQGARAEARLAAYAEPADGGERIWYFSGDGESPAVGDQTPDAILRRGIRLGAEHRPGAYRLTVLVTATPLSRPAILELARSGRGALARQTWSLSVVP
jgi:hypothetical protein